MIGVQAILLFPGFILAEATLSYVGLGFPDTVPSWGSMLHQASNVNAIADFPWTLAPAAAIVAVTLRAPTSWSKAEHREDRPAATRVGSSR